MQKKEEVSHGPMIDSEFISLFICRVLSQTTTLHGYQQSIAALSVFTSVHNPFIGNRGGDADES